MNVALVQPTKMAVKEVSSPPTLKSDLPPSCITPWQIIIQRVLDYKVQENMALMKTLMEEVSEMLEQFTTFILKVQQVCVPQGDKFPIENYRLLQSVLQVDFPEAPIYLNQGMNLLHILKCEMTAKGESFNCEAEQVVKEESEESDNDSPHQESMDYVPDLCQTEVPSLHQNDEEQSSVLDLKLENLDQDINLKHVQSMVEERPKLTLAQIAGEAIMNSEDKKMSFEQLKADIMSKYSFFKPLPPSKQPRKLTGWHYTLHKALVNNAMFVQLEQKRKETLDQEWWALSNFSSDYDWKPFFLVDEKTWAHMRVKENPKECPECGIVYKDARSIMSHWKNKDCDKIKALEEENLMAKEITGLGPKDNNGRKYICAHEDCASSSKTYTSKDSTKEHYNNSHKDSYEGTKYQCPECPETFIVNRLAKQHMKILHLEGKENRSCYMCGKVFKTRKIRDIHEKQLVCMLKKCTSRKPNMSMSQIAHEALKNSWAKKLSFEQLKAVITSKYSYFRPLPVPKSRNKPSGWNYTLLQALKTDTVFEQVRSENEENLEEQCWTLSKESKNKKMKKHTHGKITLKSQGKWPWKPFFPVDAKTWLEMRKKSRPLQCPTCDQDYKGSDVRPLIRHWKNNYCTKVKALEEGNHMAMEITGLGPEYKQGQKYVCTHEDCASSNNIYTSRFNTQEHYNNSHKDTYKGRIYQCPECPETFIVEHMVKRHFKLAHIEGKEVHPCSFCGKILKTRKLRNRHENHYCMENQLAVEKLRQTVTCEYCGSVVKSNYYPTHLKHFCPGNPEKEMKEKLFSCEVCGKEFARKNKVKEHLSTHNDAQDPKFQCPICHKFMKQSNSYRKHMVNVHKQGSKCEICNKTFYDAEFLKKHMISHEI